jgi:hypothetical protein
LFGGTVTVGALVPGVDTPPPAVGVDVDVAGGVTAVPPGESVPPTALTPAPGAVGPATPVEDVVPGTAVEAVAVADGAAAAAVLAADVPDGAAVGVLPKPEVELAPGVPDGPRTLGLPLSAGNGGAGGWGTVTAEPPTETPPGASMGTCACCVCVVAAPWASTTGVESRLDPATNRSVRAIRFTRSIWIGDAIQETSCEESGCLPIRRPPSREP